MLREEYFVIRDSKSTLKILKLEPHSVSNGKAILRFPGTVEVYEIASIRTFKTETKEVVEYELGKLLQCLKFEV